jgi:hypothetical protein
MLIYRRNGMNLKGRSPLNERFTSLYALLAAELGGSAMLLIASPQRVRNAGFTSLIDMLLPHFGILAIVWTIVAVFIWILIPGFWRIRQDLSNKLRVLGWVCAVGLLLDNVVSLCLYLDTAGLEGADVRIIHSGRALALALVLRSVAALIFFWAAVWAHYQIERRRFVQVTPPPRFGKS